MVVLKAAIPTNSQVVVQTVTRIHQIQHVRPLLRQTTQTQLRIQIQITARASNHQLLRSVLTDLRLISMATVRAKVKLRTVNSNSNNLKLKPVPMVRNQIQTDPVLLPRQTISSRRALNVLLTQIILHVNSCQKISSSRLLPITILLHHHNSNATLV